MRVLIGIDGSEAGWEAIYQLIPLLAPSDEVALYYSPPNVVFRRTAPEGQLVERTRSSLADSVLAEAAQRLPVAAREKAIKLVGEQDPRQGIKAAAEEWKADLISIGATGAGTLRGLLLGSVARAILRSTTIPVLVARKKHDKLSDDVFRVLFAVDKLPSTSLATDFLHKLHCPAKAIGRVIHVIEPLFGAEVPDWLEQKARTAADEELTRAWVQEHEAEKRHKFEEMAEYSKRLPACYATHPPIVLEGAPAEKIIETAAADDIDLIVSGTRDLGGWQRFLLGSTAEALTQHAPCSVLVLHHEEPAA